MNRNTAVFLALLAAAIGGCTVYDDRQLTIAIVGSPVVANELRVRVDASQDFSQASLSIDGWGVGTFPIGQEVALDVSALEDVQHTIEARVYAARPPPPARATFLVDRGPATVVSVDPPPGARPPGPFQVDVRFSRRIELWRGGLMYPDGSDVPSSAGVVLPDGDTVRMRATYPLEAIAPVVASLTVLDSFQRQTIVNLGPWSLAQITAAFGAPDPTTETFTNGTVTVLPIASGFEASGTPAVARLYAGDFLVADLGSPPWSAVAWDTRSVPDGLYLLRVDVPGYFVHPGDQPLVDVDRTRPVVRCAPQSGTAAEAAYGTCIELVASEFLPDAPVPLRVDGVAIAATPNGFGYFPEGSPVYSCPASPLPVPPFSLDVDVSQLVDRAGNAAIASGCTFEVPAWRTPLGAGPIRVGTRQLVATEVAIGGFLPDVRLAWIASPGAPSADRVVSSTPDYDLWGNFVGWNPDAEVSHLPSSGVVLDGGRAVWAEGAADAGDVASAVLVYLPSGWIRDPTGALDADPLQDARRPAAASHYGSVASRELVAWSESAPSRGRAIQAKVEISSVWTTINGDVRSSSGSVADEAAVGIEGGDGPRIGALLAFVESGGASPSQVRAATVDLAGDLTWSPLAGTLNLDPAGAASEPTVLAGSPFVVAWTEGGSVLARTANDPFGTGGFGAPSVLNVDAAHAARSPRAAWNDRGPVVVFVEAGPSGDEIWARRWNGASWDLLPGPVNAGTAPGVRSLSVARGPLVAWVTDGGDILIRLGNF